MPNYDQKAVPNGRRQTAKEVRTMPRGRAEDYKANHTEEGETSDQKQSKYPGADQKEDWQTDDFLKPPFSNGAGFG